MLCTLIALIQSQTVFPDFNPQQQIDGEIQKRGAALGKEIGGFETIEDQCNALFGSSIIEQAESLMEMVRNDSHAAEMAKNLQRPILQVTSTRCSNSWKIRPAAHLMNGANA